ncbi:unnamed protein product [Rhizoctonia solani]|uniref:SPO22-domain-containing protein n=1 Tax=Rhizoctonia solani TaxID=456999 RepID=A0A8H3EAJ5_9AGAM|nr:unnamed protein product [Rhizoctonia solani]
MLSGPEPNHVNALVGIKPQILDFSSTDFVSLESNLNHLNNLLEQLSSSRNAKKRTRSEEAADVLDREGVQLWNASILLRGIQNQGGAESRKRVFASLRLAAFRLIEAGSDVPPTAESLVHLLQLGSKTATALSECNDDRARSVMMSAADYESQLKTLKDEDRDMPSKETAAAQYYCGRMIAAWKDGNESVAFFMLEQATDERRLETMPIPDVEEILGRAIEIAKGLLRQSWGKEASTNAATPASTQDVTSSADGKIAAVAGQMAPKDIPSTRTSRTRRCIRITTTKRNSSAHSCTARAYFASSSAVESNLERAEATIDDVIQGKNMADLDVNLLWMKLAILKRGRADTTQISNVFRSILDKLEFQETNVMSFLREVQTVIDISVDLAISTTQGLLNKALDSPNGLGYSFVGTIAMSLLLLVKSLQHSDARSAAEKACQSIVRRIDFSMEKTSAAACQLVLWRNGEASYKAKKWIEAADWFVLSASPAFQSMAGAQSRCIRKAALCYIQQGEYAQASTLVSRCSQDESATHYVRFLTAVHQGKVTPAISGASHPLAHSHQGSKMKVRLDRNRDREDRHAEIPLAIQAVENMLSASDFDRKMLLLATQLAHETKQKTLLLAALEAMYKTLQREPHADAETEGITLVRCSIRILLDLLKEPLAATFQLIESLKNHLQRALGLINVIASRNNLTIIAKDLSWLWRTAYNAAVAGCQDWDELAVAETFDLARELMETYSTTLAAVQDTELKQCIMLSSFSATSGRLFVARRLGSTPAAAELYTKLAKDIPTFREIATGILADGVFDGDDRPGYMINLFFTFEIEVLCRVREWQRIQVVVEAATEMECVTSSTLEAMADLLWSEDACPTDVLYSALEAMLRSSLRSQNISIDKFSRWLRALCTILLARNRQQDRASALSFIEQAVEVIKDNKDDSGDQMYAHDEREWLLHIAFNTGVERFTVSDIQEAKRWIETATVLAGLVHNSDAASEKIDAVYRQVLAKYGTQLS